MRIFRAVSGTIAVMLVAVISLLNAAGCGTGRVLSIHERFRVSDGRTITDIVTGLRWKVGPDRDTGWHGAEYWIAGLEGNWRMPYRRELEELHRAGITTETWGPFENGGWFVWCVDFTSRNMAYRYSFMPSYVFSGAYPPSPAGERVFAVLPPPGYGTVALRAFRSSNLFGSPWSHLY